MDKVVAHAAVEANTQLRGADMRQCLHQFRWDMKYELEILRLEVLLELREGHLRLIKWIVPLLIGQTLVVALVKVL